MNLWCSLSRPISQRVSHTTAPGDEYPPPNLWCASTGANRCRVPRITPGDDPVIDVRALWKVFGADTASALRLGAEGAERSTIQTATGRTVGVRDVSFAVAEGETVVVMGLSGSGKSTLIRCLSGPHDITSGDVTIDGQGVVGIPADSLRSLRRSKLLRLQLELRRTIVFITHDFAETIRLGDRIAVMKDGVLEQIGTPEMVVTHPATPYVHAFTRDVPRLKVIRDHANGRRCIVATFRRSRHAGGKPHPAVSRSRRPDWRGGRFRIASRHGHDQRLPPTGRRRRSRPHMRLSDARPRHRPVQS